MARPERPSRLLALLRPFLPWDWRDDIVEDLDEAHARRRAGAGRTRAWLWLLGQVVLFAVRFAPVRTGERATRLAVDLRQDLGHAMRSARSAPVFLTTVVLTLAVGIGANTLVFSIVKTVVLEPLPYPASERLVVGGPYPWTPAPIVRDAFADGTFEATAGYYPRSFVLTGADEPVELEGVHVTPGFFSLFGTPVSLGRSFLDEDADEGARVAILSHGAWQRLFGADPAILGRPVGLNGRPHEVVGVLESGFRQHTPRVDDPDVWVVGRLERLGPETVPPESGRWAIPLGRLRASDPLEGARARADATLREAREASGRDASDADGGPSYALHWTPLAEELTREAGGALGVLQATVGMLLLLASVNVANLLLARFGARSSEVATRHALGASRPRVIRQLVTESVGLAMVGGALGVALAALSLELVLQLAPPDIPRLETVTLDAGVLLVALALALGVGAAFGLVPAVIATAGSPGGAMREGARGATGSRRRHRMSRGLATLQVGLTVVLLVGAGLTARSFTLLTGRDPGFRTDGVLVLRVNVPESRHTDVRGLDGFYRRVAERLERVPGVRSVGLANRPPIERSGSSREVRLAEGAEPRVAEYGVVGPGYFRALGVPLLRGRAFDDHDGPESVPVAIVDRAFWEDGWPGEEPIGKRFLQGGTWRTVVGVVEGVRGGGLASDREAGFYIPHLQRPDDPVELAVGRSAVFLVHAPGLADESASLSALHHAVQEEDPGQPIAEIVPLETLVAEGARPQRFRALLLGTFAAIGIVLSLSGISGVMGQLLVERRREFAVFRALGATSGAVVGRVLGWGMAVTLPGIVFGLLTVLALGPRFESLLFGVRPTDPGTLLAVSLLVVGMALSACAGPAVRAVRIDPGVALRGE